jgi:hypothetical protein
VAKDLVVILSHADTDDKVSLLEECIENLIIQNKKILISSHIDVPKHLYDKVDYVIYDKENPVIYNNEYKNSYHVVSVWLEYPQYKQTFPIEFNHAFAVHKLILNGCSLAELNGFDSIHFINYDYVIKDPEVLIRHNQFLKDYDIVSYDWINHGSAHSENISSAFFSVKINNFFDVIKKIITKDDYCNFGNPIYEEFLWNICKELNIKSIPVSDILDKNIIAAKSIMDNYIISLDDKSTLSVFLSKDSENKYLFISNHISRKALINGKEIITNPSINVYLLNSDHFNSDIEIYFPDLGIKRKFNSTTTMAIAEIKDSSIINYELVGNRKKYTINEYCDDTKPKRYDLINFLHSKFNFSNYLEIGVNNGACIRKINIPLKDGVDPNHSIEYDGSFVPEINFQMTSDDFFQNHVNTKYDVIFIDGLHHSQQVDKDIINSLAHLKEGGFILLHDCNPPTYEMQIVPRQQGLWNGDVWKSIVKARKIQGLEVSVVDTDWGVGVIRRGSQQVIQYPLEQCLDWNFFDGHREEILNIISVEEFYQKYN